MKCHTFCSTKKGEKIGRHTYSLFTVIKCFAIDSKKKFIEARCQVHANRFACQSLTKIMIQKYHLAHRIVEIKGPESWWIAKSITIEGSCGLILD